MNTVTKIKKDINQDMEQITKEYIETKKKYTSMRTHFTTIAKEQKKLKIEQLLSEIEKMAKRYVEIEAKRIEIEEQLYIISTNEKETYQEMENLYRSLSSKYKSKLTGNRTNRIQELLFWLDPWYDIKPFCEYCDMVEKSNKKQRKFLKEITL